MCAPHSHDAADSVDSELEASQLGIRTLISFAGLADTAAIQLSWSCCRTAWPFAGTRPTTSRRPHRHILGDRLHPRTPGRDPPLTYGYGRAKDLAGLVVVILITASSALAAYVAFRRLLHPDGVDHLLLVAAASLIGFVGNE